MSLEGSTHGEGLLGDAVRQAGHPGGWMLGWQFLFSPKCCWRVLKWRCELPRRWFTVSAVWKVDSRVTSGCEKDQ